MSAGTLIRAARDAGVALTFGDGKIKAHGRADVVSLWAPRLREHKAALVDYLQAANDPIGNPAPEPPTHTGDWRELADAYNRHHFKCAVCIAAGKGYGLRCGAGAALWSAYEAQP